jgi:L-histidine N-alpha-methyltransferase
MPILATPTELLQATADAAHKGLTAVARSLPPWLFYDDIGTLLFERITELPEYYLTRVERGILKTNADEILRLAASSRPLSIVELGCGSASKSGILLSALVRHQASALYQPVDVSKTALDLAQKSIRHQVSGVACRPQLANYVHQPLKLDRSPCGRILAVYLGSSVGNFPPIEAQDVLNNVRAQLEKGDSLLLGTDLIKDEKTLLIAYDDPAGATAAFNRNILTRLNRELGANFNPDSFEHTVIWNRYESCIEMHLRSAKNQEVRIPPTAGYPELTITFRVGESIHTESSYKFTFASVSSLLNWSGFSSVRTWQDPDRMFAVTLATAM